MDGLELQSQLAAAGYGIPIIFITAYDDKGFSRTSDAGRSRCILGQALQ